MTSETEPTPTPPVSDAPEAGRAGRRSDAAAGELAATGRNAAVRDGSGGDGDDDRASLEAEREFLLRSLDDLDGERDAGNIDDGTYRRLHDDYTARAAAVLRALRDGVDDRPPKPPPLPLRRKLLVAGAIGGFAVLAALLLASALGRRLPGQTPTGNSQLQGSSADQSTAARLADLKQAAATHPQSYDAHINYARALLNQDPLEALKQFDAASSIDPTQPEPRAYSGWTLALVSRSAQDAAQRKTLLDGAMARFDAAARLRPDYPDTYVFRGLTEFEFLSDPKAAIPDFQRFLALAPDHPMASVVQGALAQAVAEVPGASVPTVPTTTPSTTTPAARP